MINQTTDYKDFNHGFHRLTQIKILCYIIGMVFLFGSFGNYVFGCCNPPPTCNPDNCLYPNSCISCGYYGNCYGACCKWRQCEYCDWLITQSCQPTYNPSTDKCCGNGYACPKNSTCCGNGGCCDPALCQTCGSDGQCVTCGGNPNQCCDPNGVCKACCRRATTGYCESHNQDCGCDPLGLGDCSGKSKEWMIGVQHTCYSECGGEPCFKGVIPDAPCYAIRPCTGGDISIKSVCIGGSYCQWSSVGFCQTCIATGDAIAVEAMDCQCN